MKILRIHLCYDTGDKIILDKEGDLSRFDLSKVRNFEVHAQLDREEFDRLRGFGQVVTTDSATSVNNVSTVEIKQLGRDFSY